jgi:hypothetical protein
MHGVKGVTDRRRLVHFLTALRALTVIAHLRSPLPFSVAANIRTAAAADSFANPPAAFSFSNITSFSAADPCMSRLSVTTMLLRFGSSASATSGTRHIWLANRLPVSPDLCLSSPLFQLLPRCQINYVPVDRSPWCLTTGELSDRYRIARGKGSLETFIKEFIQVPLLFTSL